MAVLSWIKVVFLIGLPYICMQENINKGEIIFHYNNTYKYNVPYTISVNKSTEYILEFAGETEAYDTPARVTVASDFANKTYPLFITARQQKGVFSWQLPMLVQTPVSLEQFTNISRTLCPHNNMFTDDEDTCDVSTQNTPIIHLTSSSPDSINVTILVETVTDFFVRLNSTTNLTITPSQPMYYFFPFDQSNDLDLSYRHAKRKYLCNTELNDDEQTTLHKHYLMSNLDSHSWLYRPKSVIVMIESDDDICAVVSIQNFSCPVFDNERDILYDGYYLTMTRRGGITLTQDTFPVGFYIVFIVKTSDEDCTDKAGNNTLPRVAHYLGWAEEEVVQLVTNDGRVKTFSFRIIQTISYQEYAIAAGAVLAFFSSFYVAFIIAVFCRKKVIGHGQGQGQLVTSEEEGLSTPPVPQDLPSSGPTRRRRVAIDSHSGESSRHCLVGEGDMYAEQRTCPDGSSSSDTESDFSTLDDVNTDKDIYRLGGKLCVANLARCRPRVLSARSKMYLWNVLTVAVFYTLPVIQLVVTYQRLLNQSGNQDLCYFNFLCAHPLLVLSDFNHVYSNLGYVLLGLLFLAQVWRRHSTHQNKTPEQKELGIPQHFGLLYAMGIALVSEGLLSAAYHVCPNSMNFQFDTSFMYVTSVLCMVKIYQSRHPDINARAHATFGVLALIIFIGLVGVLNANFYFWIAFTVLHLVTCLIMTFQIYYLGRFRLDGGLVSRAARSLLSRPLAAITPTHCGRCVLLLIANLANWAIAAYGVAQHSRDFASHLLLVLMSNLFLYTLFYIVMKLLHRESIRWYSWVFIAMTYSIWFGSSYFYLDQNTNWALTPAQSRQNNRQCSLLQLYDSHDIWHFLSSTAMFFSFNMYLTIDDNLSRTPRSNIMVF
ncbi:SID1 transmembrane family member 1-like [Trichoplusia ni]|uniref:SID1 transmembrane family member 1-like n=1 Tax=Trichoplusia ni TaxID=7111 RepID=A0A7E5W230_TRINI|nr:SID1 transmembrane family member 1-like [Trichoplusia ni]